MKIVIRGAGDLATGIASRLYHGGHQIIMTETKEPLTVRRMAALSRAVYEDTACVEDLMGVLAHSPQEAEKILQGGDIPVLVDETAATAFKLAPDVAVDAILAKRNTGTSIGDAPFVIGIGPGFTAGKDCNCVIETQRGHTLGTVIYKGSAIPDTGIPADVGGYTTERLIRAAGNGEMEPKAAIGDLVKKGQIVAVTGGREVCAKMDGIVRGMLQAGVRVKENLKIGDIDCRCEPNHCFTISDKARAVGGGVLEAVSGYQAMRDRYAIAVLAAGKSLRFGGNKLLAEVKGKPLFQYTLERLAAFRDFPAFIVTGYEEIAEKAGSQGFCVIRNNTPQLGISHSIRLAIKACTREYPDIQGILFCVCDQPGLSASTMQRIFNEAFLHRGRIICACHEGKTGNPVLWDRQFFKDLLALGGDEGGRRLLARFASYVRHVEALEEELKDIDYRTEL